MTNEELVAFIQQGKKQFLVDLWAQMEGLVKWQAKRTMSGIRGMSSNCGVEFDDLYQSGYLALVKAVDTYKSDMGMTFAGWLIFYLRSAFAQVSGFCTQKQRCDPLRFSISLNAPLKDEDGATFEDIQADPESSTGFEDIEQEIYIFMVFGKLWRQNWRRSRHGKPKYFGSDISGIFLWIILLPTLASASPVFSSWSLVG